MTCHFLNQREIGSLTNHVVMQSTPTIWPLKCRQWWQTPTRIIIKLELCAFALKGEHNVYSLVPNIAVCMYIYIDTKFSYDNNVYFSIFCEHRQLKHGMHVIDPSREVSSHCMTVQVGTSGFMWLKVVLCG